MVPKKPFFTEGVDRHKGEPRSFELEVKKGVTMQDRRIVNTYCNVSEHAC